MMNNNYEEYFYASKNILYSLLLIIPMLFLYEILGFIQNYDSNYYIRNGADAIIRHLFSPFGENENVYENTFAAKKYLNSRGIDNKKIKKIRTTFPFIGPFRGPITLPYVTVCLAR